MNRLAFVTSLLALALGFAASTLARADFAVVQFGNGYCRIWRDSADNPWGANWKKIVVGLPDWGAAHVALSSARAQSLCP
jgi:hypothetical protein